MISGIEGAWQSIGIMNQKEFLLKKRIWNLFCLYNCIIQKFITKKSIRCRLYKKIVVGTFLIDFFCITKYDENVKNREVRKMLLWGGFEWIWNIFG